MRIVVLDGFAVNPGDLSWDALAELGELTIYDRTDSDEVVSRSARAELLITNKTALPAGVLEQLPDVKYIGVLATGFNVVDVVAARNQGIVVTNVPAYGSLAVAQHTFALLLELTNHVGQHAQGVAAGSWQASKDWCYWEVPLVELQGKTLGIIGMGNIGRHVSRIAEAFGMKAHSASRGEDPVALSVESDVVSLHCPLTDETREMVNREFLARMKTSALLLNTARGGLIEEQALADALNAGEIGGAGLDVLSVEPPVMGNPLIGAKNCIITPHVGWAAKAARQRLLDAAVGNVKAWLVGAPLNVVNV